MHIFTCFFQFYIDDKWHTWIDYDKFHELRAAHESSSGKTKFSALDYVRATPDWAVYGANERGFNPNDKRHYRNKIKNAKNGEQLTETDNSNHTTNTMEEVHETRKSTLINGIRNGTDTEDQVYSDGDR